MTRPWHASPGPVRLTFDDEVVRVAREAVDRRVSSDRICKGREPFVRAAVRGDDDRALPMTLDHQLVDVATTVGVHGVEAEVVHDQQVGCEQPSHLEFVRVVEPCVSSQFASAIWLAPVLGLEPAVVEFHDAPLLPQRSVTNFIAEHLRVPSGLDLKIVPADQLLKRALA
jgi:hypothetical protein